MHQHFELIRAQTGQVPVPMPWRRDKNLMDLSVDFQQSQSHSNQSNDNLTAVIGRNGTGKSHLLVAIVQTFIQLEELALGKRTNLRHLPLQLLVYRVDADLCVIEKGTNGEPHATVNGQSVKISQLPMPNRVVAITTSPFDKFPVPASGHHSVAPASPRSMYRYLGLRDRTGRAALENLLFRSLNSLFETTDNEALRRANIGKVFQFLDLKPTISVVYRISVTSKIMKSLRAGTSILEEDVISNATRLKRTQDVLKNNDMSEIEFRELLLIALSNSSNGMLTLTANFDTGGNLDTLFHTLRPLRRAGFLQLRAVEVTQAHGLVSDLKRASSGQLSMASALLSLASEIANGSLVLIDEPELSLHPEWQVKYVELLLQTFSNYLGCHYVIATHSPLVISELPAHATVLSLDDIKAPSAEDLAGQSADFLLAEAFGLPSNKNRYVKDRIVQALQLAAEGKSQSREFQLEVMHLRRFSEKMDTSNPMKIVIEGLELAVAGEEGSKKK